MSEVPLEYKVMKKKLFKNVQTAIGTDLVGVLVYGGSASDRIFSGVSDIDFLIILKKSSELSKSLAEIYKAIGESFSEFLENPLFAGILDYEIYMLDQMPTKSSFNGFSPIRALCIKQAEILFGENPIKDLEISDNALKEGARRMIQEYLDKVTSVLFMANFDVEPEEEDDEPVSNKESLDAEKDFLAVDAILSSAQAYLILKNRKYVPMPDVALSAEVEPIDGVDNEVLIKAGLLKQGVETEVPNLYERSIDYCASMLSRI